MILFYDTVGLNESMTIYRDSVDKKRFYFAPVAAELAKRPDGKLHFAARLFENNGLGFAIYNFAVHATLPEGELEGARAELERNYGPGIALTQIEGTQKGPTLGPITDFDYKQIKCSSNGVEIRSVLACSFRVEEWIHPKLMKFFMDERDAWMGAIAWQTQTQMAPFKWEIRANFHSVYNYFKAGFGGKYWDIGGSLSTEIDKLMQSEMLKVTIQGGSPDDRTKVRAMAEAIAARMFKPTLEPKPQPGTPDAATFRLALDLTHSEEDKESSFSGEEAEYQTRDCEVAAMIGGVPSEYFSRNSIRFLQEQVESDPMWPYSYMSDEELGQNRLL